MLDDMNLLLEDHDPSEVSDVNLDENNHKNLDEDVRKILGRININFRENSRHNVFL